MEAWCVLEPVSCKPLILNHPLSCTICPPPSLLDSDAGAGCDTHADGSPLSGETLSAPAPSPYSGTIVRTHYWRTPSPSSHTAVGHYWWGLGLTVAASAVAGVVVLMYFCRRRRLPCSRRSNAGVEVLSELLKDEAHSDHMVSADGRDAQRSDGTWMPPVLSTGTVPRDAQDDHGIGMTPVRSIVTVPRYARDLDGISPSSLQLLLRESAAPAFMGKGLSLVPKANPYQHTHASPSQ